MEEHRNWLEVRRLLIEELDAVNKCRMRIDDTNDESLRNDLLREIKERKKHIATLVERLKKNDLTETRRSRSAIRSGM